LASAPLRRRTDLVERVAALSAQSTPADISTRQEHYRQLDAPLVSYAFELDTIISRTFGLDARHPFADRRLVELCYALPPQQKLTDGWTRYVVRNALDGVMPDAIRWRGGKAVNSAAVTKGMRVKDGKCLDAIIYGEMSSLADYINVTELRSTYRRYQSTGNEQDEMYIWQAVGLALWLRKADVTR
jgi:asparagine synthase (glutamine-hydrolysing)